MRNGQKRIDKFVINRRFDSPPVSRGAYRMNRTGKRLENRIPISFLKPQVAQFNLFFASEPYGSDDSAEVMKT